MKIINNQQSLRKCIATSKILSKDQLIRIVKTKKGEVLIDLKQNIEGRGAYISKDRTLIKKLFKNKLLNKVFKTEIDKKVYDELIKIMEVYDE